jgi:hypothetical protein
MFRTLSAHHQGNIRRYCMKQLHNNTWSVVYVDLQTYVISLMMGRKGSKHVAV